MFEKEAEKYAFDEVKYKQEWYIKHPEHSIDCDYEDIKKHWRKGAEFGYEKCKEELTERLENATEIIELMKDLFFACWQEKGINAIKFEQRVNDFLKGE